MLTMEIGKQIRKILDNKGISQHDLSKRTGLRIENINRLVNGKGNPTVNTLERIAIGLQVPVTSLLGSAGSRVNSRPREAINKDLTPYIGFISEKKNLKWLEFAYYVSTLNVTKQEAVTVISTYHSVKNNPTL